MAGIDEHHQGSVEGCAGIQISEVISALHQWRPSAVMSAVVLFSCADSQISGVVASAYRHRPVEPRAAQPAGRFVHSANDTISGKGESYCQAFRAPVARNLARKLTLHRR